MKRAPTPIAGTVAELVERIAPATTLAKVQSVWRSAVGEAVAREVVPVSERAGVLVLATRTSVWANEIELLSGQLIEKINLALGSEVVAKLRITVDPGKF